MLAGDSDSNLDLFLNWEVGIVLMIGFESVLDWFGLFIGICSAINLKLNWI